MNSGSADRGTAIGVMSLSKELVFLILQFLDEENLKETAHILERETGYFFDMKYFEGLALSGNWDEVERYLSGFTKVEDNKFSLKIYFEIRKQKFLEALDNHDGSKALGILVNDLKVFASYNEDLYKEMTQLLTTDDFRKHESLSTYRDTNSARIIMMKDLKKVIEANPLFRGKLKFPNFRSQRLRRLINQSLNWQHVHCSYPQPDPVIKTLFLDHVCQPLDNHSIVNNPPPSEVASAPVPTSPSSCTFTPSTVTHSAVSAGTVGLCAPRNPAETLEELKDSESLSKTGTLETLDEVTSGFTYPGQGQSSVFRLPDDFPKLVQKTLNEGSSPVSMDFHPVQSTLLIVGTIVGDIGLWEVLSGEKLLSRSFKVWDIGACSPIFKAAMVKDPCVSVKCIRWSPDGSIFGVAYSKHILQLYSYGGASDVQPKLEFDAHVGGVNDLAFCAPDKKLMVISCGDDKIVKVWDAVNGVKMFTFEGHEASVYSVLPHTKERIHFIFSTSVDGKIKAWLYDNLGARVDFDAPGHWCTTMAYSDDNKRIFSCGTSKDGESFLVEWNETEGSLKRIYHGLRKPSIGILQFDTAKNQFLAVGDDHLIKLWDMDNVELLTTIDADGDLPASPCVRFNKEGTLLAVFAKGNRIKILANDSSPKLQQTSENNYLASSSLSEILSELSISQISSVGSAGMEDGGVPVNEGTRSLENVKPILTEEANGNISNIYYPPQFQFLSLPAKTNKVSSLIYNNAGDSILALGSNVHVVWKWPQNDLNMSGKATTKIPPQLWKPKGRSQLIGDYSAGTNPADVVACFVFSKNDSYGISASGGKISVFNMLTYKKMTTFMSSPPMATFLALHPQDNNIIAVGLDDSTIVIYNVRNDEVENKLKGHFGKITGLAFSEVLNVLVSSGADAQIVVWNYDGWERVNSRSMQIPDEGPPLSDIRIQFHQDQIHFLAVHDTCLEIYEAKKLECIGQWVTGKFSAEISHATFSSDSQLVYAIFLDGTASVFNTPNFHLQCRIDFNACIPLDIRCDVCPLVVAAHPNNPNQFAVGLSNGGIHIIEPLESVGKWTALPPVVDPLA